MYDRDDEKFFVQPVVYVSDDKDKSPDYTAMTAEFGDGYNRIFSALYEDRVGITIYRETELDPHLSLDASKGDTLPNPESDQNVIALNFSTVQSIDAVISRLQYIREQLLLKENVPELARITLEERNEAIAKEHDLLEEGDLCPECLNGRLQKEQDDCRCHVAPPCNACVEAILVCANCGWDVQ